jgi:hypothetical protein
MGLGGTELLTLNWRDQELAGWQILGPAEMALLGILIRAEVWDSQAETSLPAPSFTPDVGGLEN